MKTEAQVRKKIKCLQQDLAAHPYSSGFNDTAKIEVLKWVLENGV